MDEKKTIQPTLNSTVNTKTVSHLLSCSKGTTPGLPIVGIDIKFSPFPNSRVGLGWFLSRNIVVCVVVFQDFPTGLINLDTPAKLDKGWVGCRLWLGHRAWRRSNAAGYTATSNCVVVANHRGVSGSGRYIRSSVHAVVGSHFRLFRFKFVVFLLWICILLLCFSSSPSNAMKSNGIQFNSTQSNCSTLEGN